ncbi:MAG: Mrp/NBP35 family ATP-binding protein [Candidatus Kapaibacteriales bacterium]
MLEEHRIKHLIQDIKDPHTGRTLSEMGSIAKIEHTSDSKTTIKITADGPVYWIAQKYNEAVIAELRKEDPKHEYEILIAEKPKPGIDKRSYLPNVKNIIAVASGKGGVGKSAVSSNLAAALAQKGASVGILDGDIYGPSQPTMFGLANAKLEAVVMPDGSTKARPTEKYGVKVASMGFMMEKDQAAILRGPMLAGYFSMLFEQLEWGPLDFLIFDLPPGTGDIQLTLTQKIPLTGAVVVTTPQEISLADVRRSISMFRKVNVDVFGIVENMSWFTPPGSEEKYHIFGKGGGQSVADEMDTELLGQVPLDIEMREMGDGGMPIVIKDQNHSQSKRFIDIADRLAGKVRAANHKSAMQNIPMIQL